MFGYNETSERHCSSSTITYCKNIKGVYHSFLQRLSFDRLYLISFFYGDDVEELSVSGAVESNFLLTDLAQYSKSLYCEGDAYGNSDG